MELNLWRKNIRILRKNEGFNQAQLASKLNVTDKTISNWETGISSPDLTELLSLCKFFRISTDTLFNNTDLIEKEKTRNFNTNTELKSGRISDLNHQKEENNNLVREASGHYITQNPIIEELRAEVARQAKIIDFLTDHMEGLKAALIQERSQHPPPPSSKKKAG